MATIHLMSGFMGFGKTTVSVLLSERLANTLFIEVDDLLSDAEEETLGLALQDGWAERLNRLDAEIAEAKTQNYRYIIFAYPMNEKNYLRWNKFADLNTVFLNITLAPSMEICLQNRGHRALSEWEQKRIEQMYRENYQAPAHADLIIDNSRQTPDETTQVIMNFLSERENRENI